MKNPKRKKRGPAAVSQGEENVVGSRPSFPRNSNHVGGSASYERFERVRGCHWYWYVNEGRRPGRAGCTMH